MDEAVVVMVVEEEPSEGCLRADGESRRSPNLGDLQTEHLPFVDGGAESVRL